MEQKIIKFSTKKQNFDNVFQINNFLSKNIESIKEYKKINSISSYLAMFPLEIPAQLILKYTKENDLVMDNFSGRGTTALAARMLHRNFIGNDLNPYSYVLTKFKISKLESLNEIINRIDELEVQSSRYNISDNYLDEELLYFYHKNTLKQLYFLRETIGENWLKNDEINNSILAISLGLMHGKFNSKNKTNYFSLSMPNVISMSPNYVKKYSIENKLEKPNVNIFELIKKRLIYKYSNLLMKKDNYLFFAYWNSLNALDFVKKESVNIVITSPPYLSLVNYTTSNWLKLWLLGFNRKELKKEIKLNNHFKYEDYKMFLKRYLENIYPYLSIKAKICLIVGDVHGIDLISKVWSEIKCDLNYQFLEMYEDFIPDNRKVLKIMNSKKGRATKKEIIFILEKI